MLESETLGPLRMYVSVEEEAWGSGLMSHNMADNFVPSWPIILNKSLEQSDVHRLLGQSHKVRGRYNPKENSLVRSFGF